MSIYFLQLKRGGTLVVKEWDNTANDYIEREIEEDEVNYFFNETICFEKNLVLRDVFLLINRYPEAFVNMTLCPFLFDVVEEGLSDHIRNEFLNNIVFLELRRSAIIEEEFGSKYLQRLSEFYGVGNGQEYAIELSPINSLAMLPLRLNEEVKVIEFVDNEKKEHFKYLEKFTLHDVISGIVNEIGFIGNSEERAMMLESIKKAAEEMDDMDEDSFTNFDDLKERLNKTLEENKIPCKLCGADSRSSHFDKPKNVCFKCFQKGKGN
jgi:hypothetical protein